MHEPGLLLGRVGNLCEACTAAGWRGGRRQQSWPCRPQEREASERPACRRLKMGRGLVSRPTRSALITFAAVASAMRLWQHGGGLSPCSAGELYPRVRCPLLTTSKAGTRNWNGISFVSWAQFIGPTYGPDARSRCMGLCWQWVLAFGSETPQTPRTRPALRHIRDGSSVCSIASALLPAPLTGGGVAARSRARFLFRVDRDHVECTCTSCVRHTDTMTD